MIYYHFSEIKINDFNEKNVEDKYNEGFVFTRLGRGVMQQVRSVRVPLSAFEPSSENRRILKKHEHIVTSFYPHDNFLYDWHVGKMAQTFYRRKFGPEVMSANKIREMCTDGKKSNMNGVLVFTSLGGGAVGYCLMYTTPHLFHYAYPFYDLQLVQQFPSLGMAMMTKAVVWAKEVGKEYIYLGSIQNEKSLYKFQFKEVEWFDGHTWRSDKPKI